MTPFNRRLCIGRGKSRRISTDQSQANTVSLLSEVGFDLGETTLARHEIDTETRDPLDVTPPASRMIPKFDKYVSTLCEPGII